MGRLLHCNWFHQSAAQLRCAGLCAAQFSRLSFAFFLAPSTCRPCSVGSISSVVWLKCHHVPRWLITHLSGAHASCGASFREKLIDVSRRFSNSALSL